MVLAIMDGIGVGRGDDADAVAKARTPILDRLRREALNTLLCAHGRAVGMPTDEDMGNSEVGHNALGAGRVFDQGAKLVSASIASGRLFEGAVWKELVSKVLREGTSLHFIGLLSDGNVHSHIDHLRALLVRAAQEGVRRACVHALLDGRDVPKTSAHLYVERLEATLAEINREPGRRFRIASGGGRMTTTMDRYEADWGMVERGWHAHVLGQARAFASAGDALRTFRAEEPGVNDQDLPAFVITENGRPVGPIEDGDAVIVFNFRGDRMLELTRAFEDAGFDKLDRVRYPRVLFAGMMQYDGDTKRPARYLVSPPEIDCTLSELLCDAGVTQLACSETQKFGHVTYFWNGNRTGYFDPKLERYVEVPSLPPPFDGRPEMRAREIADTVVREIQGGRYRFLRLNFANGDMVGHTGNFAATVAAVESVDQALATLFEATLAARGAFIVTADHGNADDMGERDKKTGRLLFDEQGKMVPRTSHSLNPVPLHLVLRPEVQARYAHASVQNPGLGNVAATIALLLGFAPPAEYLPALISPSVGFGTGLQARGSNV